jgi:uncharacterized OB-fold protein
MSEYKRPLPVVTEATKPHWEAAREHKYLIQRCSDCGHSWFPPAPNCQRCLSSNVEWVEASGRGEVYSFIVYHQGWHPGFADSVPYNLAIIQLEEGVRVMNNIVGTDNDKIRVGMAVEVTFDDVTEEVTIPRFKPA